MHRRPTFRSLVPPAVAAVLALVASGSVAARLQVPGLIVFESNRSGGSDIWIANADGSAARDLTRGSKASEMSPSLSPDGKRIVFARALGGRSRLWLMNADGTGARRLGTWTGSATHPVWSPAGDRVAFVSLQAGRWDLFVTTLAGSRIRLTNGAAAELDVSWSPRGDRLVFDRIQGGSSDLWTVASSGGPARRLTRTPALDELNPAWSPGGDEIAFDAAGSGGAYDLYVRELSSGKSRPLTHDGADDGDPAWAPDGSRLAFRRELERGYGIATIAASGNAAPEVVVGDPGRLDFAPSWQAGSTRTAQAAGAGVALGFTCDEEWPRRYYGATLIGTEAGDHMCGGRANDRIWGQDGGDFEAGGGGQDDLHGNRGDDWLRARDARRDYLFGEEGTDHAFVDAADVLFGVEAPET
jgi:dipeptidyl aminopeptidase/acylaminoacyl peptidase